VAGASNAAATFDVRDDKDKKVATLTAKSPGTWGNNILVSVGDAPSDCLVDEVYTSGFDKLHYTGIKNTPQNRFRVFRGSSKTSQTLNVLYAPTDGSAAPTPASGQVLINPTDGSLTFASGEKPIYKNGDQLSATYLVDKAGCVEVSLTYGTA